MMASCLHRNINKWYINNKKEGLAPPFLLSHQKYG